MRRTTNIEWVPVPVTTSYPNHVLITLLAFCNHAISNAPVSFGGLIMLTNSQFLLIYDLAYFLIVSD